MAWNADAQQISASFVPPKRFVEGRYQVNGRPIVLGDIRVPMFAVSTERDHVAPWRLFTRLI